MAAGRPRHVRQFGIFGVAGFLRAEVGALHLGFGAQDELAFIGIDHRLVALFGAVQHAAQAAEGRNAQRARQDGGVTGRAGFLDRNTGDAARMPIQQFGRTQPPGQQDRTFGHRRTGHLAGQRGQQAVGEILHVGEAFAQIGVADAAHPVMQLAGDALHRGLGGQAAADHLARPGAASRHRTATSR